MRRTTSTSSTCGIRLWESAPHKPHGDDGDDDDYHYDYYHEYLHDDNGMIEQIDWRERKPPQVAYVSQDLKS